MHTRRSNKENSVIRNSEEQLTRKALGGTRLTKGVGEIR